MAEGDSETRTISAPTGNARSVAGLMAIAMAFSVVGAELKGDESKTGSSALSEPFIIIAGGTFATVILTLISDAGETGRQFAVGIAALAVVTATLVNGGPVWKAALAILGSKATTPTTSTTATTPTGSTPMTPATTPTAA